MDPRQTTPPAVFDADGYLGLPCPGGSASTTATFFTQDWSPESFATAGTTPPTRSPAKFRETGPPLLPRVRIQDQVMESGPRDPYLAGHLRTRSAPANGFPIQFGTQMPLINDHHRRSASPANFDFAVALSAPPCQPPVMIDVVQSHRPSIAQSRSLSSSSINSHSRNSSSGSIDASMLTRYGYPTYRHSPTPQPSALSRTPSAMNHLAPISMPGGQMQSYPPRRRTASPPAKPSSLSSELEFDPALDLTESTLLEYLTKPNPAPATIQRIPVERSGQNSHFWFDVRNVRSWPAFDVNTMSAMPHLTELLRVGVALRSLPEPCRVDLNPETRHQLTELCTNHHVVKVNAALKLAQGDHHIAIRALTPGPRFRQQPEFVSNYQSDAERTISGDGRGRVVGLVRCFDEWNSGMRTENPQARVDYLRGLAALHKHMRDHGCRYGFIMTEIELVCVRAGGPPTEAGVPLFGFLELAAPVRMAAAGLARDGSVQMTAGLALWYLHLLAKEQPLPGQYGWRLDIGGPVALTRQHHLERDDWMPKPHGQEKREAKRMRGWVFPNEPYSKKEGGGARRQRA